MLIVAGKFDPQDDAGGPSGTTLGKLPKPDAQAAAGIHGGAGAGRRTRGHPAPRRRHAAGQRPCTTFPAAGSADFARLDLATTMLCGHARRDGCIAMLVPGKLASDVFGFTMEQRDPGVMLFGAQLRNAGMNLDASLKALTGTLESVGRKPFTQEELDRARSEWLRDWEQTYSDPQKMGVALSEAIASGDWRLFFLQRDRVREAKLAEVQRVATEYLLPSNRTAGRYIPTAKPLRAPANTRVDLTGVLKDYKGDPGYTQAARLRSHAGQYRQADARGAPWTCPTARWSVALLPKPTRGAPRARALLVQFGNADTLRGQRAVARRRGGYAGPGHVQAVAPGHPGPLRPAEGGRQLQRVRHQSVGFHLHHARQSARRGGDGRWTSCATPTSRRRSWTNTRPRPSPAIQNAHERTLRHWRGAPWRAGQSLARRMTSATCPPSRNRWPASAPCRMTYWHASISAFTAPAPSPSPR